MPSRSDSYGPAGQGQIVAQPDKAIQGCPCSWCSRNGYNPQMVRYTTEHQGPYENQTLGGNHPISIAAAMDNQTQVWSVGPQALVCYHIAALRHSLKSSSSRMLGMHLCRGSEPSRGSDWCGARPGSMLRCTSLRASSASCRALCQQP